jgi:hypothetical protein
VCSDIFNSDLPLAFLPNLDHQVLDPNLGKKPELAISELAIPVPVNLK